MSSLRIAIITAFISFLTSGGGRDLHSLLFTRSSKVKKRTIKAGGASIYIKKIQLPPAEAAVWGVLPCGVTGGCRRCDSETPQQVLLKTLRQPEMTHGENYQARPPFCVLRVERVEEDILHSSGRSAATRCQRGAPSREEPPPEWL